MQLNWTDLAEADLDHIENHITKENSPAIALDAVFKVIDTVELILPDHPAAGREGRLEGTRELVIDTLPFIVIYRHLERAEEVQVLRVLHDAQQWPPED